MSAYFKHHFLIAMPSIVDAYFAHAVLYVIEHDHNGAAAFIVNKTLPMQEQQLLEQVGLTPETAMQRAVRYGGPVGQEQAFILYKPQANFTANLGSQVLAISSQVDDLQQIANDQGPEHYALCLGYAGWGPQQLDNEIKQNDWLILDATEDLLWHEDYEQLRKRCLKALNINPAFLSKTGGRA